MINSFNRLPKLMKLQIETFKNIANIPQEVNVVEEIDKNVFLNSYNSTVFEKLNENMTFFELRSLLIPHYVSWKFNICISNQNATMRRTFFFKSWHLINKNIDFLKNNIGFKFNTVSTFQTSNVWKKSIIFRLEDNFFFPRLVNFIFNSLVGLHYKIQKVFRKCYEKLI